MSASPRACPASAPAAGPGASVPSCPERSTCPAVPAGPVAALLPRDGAERAVMLALRYVAAAAETGDAACFDAAFDGAEAAFGPRDGALLVARAAALVRALRREEGGEEEGHGEGFAPRFLPPPCRFLSPGESRILALLRLRLSDGQDIDGRAEPPDPSGPSSSAASAALADLAVPVRSAGRPLLPPAAVLSTAGRAGRGPGPRSTVERRSER